MCIQVPFVYLLSAASTLIWNTHILSSNSIAQDVDASLLKKLETKRFGSGENKKPRGKKLSVPAGRSYTSREDNHSDRSNYSGEKEDEADWEMDEEVEVEEGRSQLTKSC